MRHLIVKSQNIFNGLMESFQNVFFQLLFRHEQFNFKNGLYLGTLCLSYFYNRCLLTSFRVIFLKKNIEISQCIVTLPPLSASLQICYNSPILNWNNSIKYYGNCNRLIIKHYTKVHYPILIIIRVI